MLLSYHFWKLARKFSSYEPYEVNLDSLRAWIRQFKNEDVPLVLDLLRRIKYFTKEETEELLVSLNQKLLSQLLSQGIDPDHVIYMQVHEAGSSSGAILNALRNRGRIEQNRSHLLHSDSGIKLHELTYKLQSGAIIYVDDFSASGNQFREVHKLVAPYIQSTFEQYFLLPCICEEAIFQLGKLNVQPVTRYVHNKADRPLHQLGFELDIATKNRLRELCRQVNPKSPLGFEDMATMVVFQHNSPNTLPAVLRGEHRSGTFRGIFPRTRDLPAFPIEEIS